MYKGRDFDNYLRHSISKAADGSAVLHLLPVSTTGETTPDAGSRSIRNILETLFKEIPGSANQFAIQVDAALIGGGGGGGITHHSFLTGLSNDDHPQYHTDARGDARYYRKSQVDGFINTKARTYVIDSTGTSITLDPGTPATLPTSPLENDTLIEAYDNALLFWTYAAGWQLIIRYNFPKSASNRTITATDLLERTDDLVIIDAASNAVEAMLPAAPSDNDLIKVMAKDLTNAGTVGRNGKLINGIASNLQIFSEYNVYKFRYIASLNSWITE